MEQQELERRVRELFEAQGFEVRETDNGFEAHSGNDNKRIQVFSSEDFTGGEVKQRAESGAILFVDEELEELKTELDVSVLREEREQDHKLPSYEIIGDVAVINELTVTEDEAVEGIRGHHPHVRTILLKQEPLEGEFRVGEYEKLYGEETETVHTEFGCRYRVDPTEVYFSERLATERKRVADQVENGENVLVIGAGVGPYPILMAREGSPSRVVAVEKNPEAFQYLEANIELNNVEDTVEAVEGDAREVTPGEMFDRVVVAVPEFGDEFLELALEHLSEDGTIHYYRFLEQGNWEELEQEVEGAAGEKQFEIVDRTVCGERGPGVERVCLDIKRK